MRDDMHEDVTEVNTDYLHRLEKRSAILEKMMSFLRLEWEDEFTEEEWDDMFPADPAGDKIYDYIVSHITTPALMKMCKEFDHDIHIDACGKPDHDHCINCNQRFPGRAVERDVGKVQTDPKSFLDRYL